MPQTFPTILSAKDFEKLFKQYKSDFVMVARSYVRDGMVAEDIVSDCFAYYWENRDRIEITKTIPAYILASVKNKCLNWLRDERNRLKIQQDMHSHSIRVFTERISNLEASSSEEMFEVEISSIVGQSLDAMPEKMRNVFTSSRIENLTYKQIAEKLNLSLNQVDFEMRKATEFLSRALKDYLPG
jgi:RNA polymerase sigma-70 factor (ECF subfamily)